VDRAGSTRSAGVLPRRRRRPPPRRLRFRYVDDRPANEDNSLIARGYFLVDLLGSYRWRNLELGVTIFNLTNTDWREAQFADTPCTRNAIQSPDPNAACYSKPGKNAVDPPEQITFTPGVPIGVRGGLTIYF
jgi:TonB dependent receptor